MRTTVTLTPEAETLVHSAMAQGKSFKEVVNQAIVTALAPIMTRPFHTKTQALGQFNPSAVGLDLDAVKTLALAGALEDQELARRREMGK
jgi:hypothetical protein